MDGSGGRVVCGECPVSVPPLVVLLRCCRIARLNLLFIKWCPERDLNP